MSRAKSSSWSAKSYLNSAAVWFLGIGTRWEGGEAIGAKKWSWQNQLSRAPVDSRDGDDDDHDGDHDDDHNDDHDDGDFDGHKENDEDHFP